MLALLVGFLQAGFTGVNDLLALDHLCAGLFKLLEDLAVGTLCNLILEDRELVLLEVELLFELLVLPGDFSDRLQLRGDLSGKKEITSLDCWECVRNFLETYLVIDSFVLSQLRAEFSKFLKLHEAVCVGGRRSTSEGALGVVDVSIVSH